MFILLDAMMNECTPIRRFYTFQEAIGFIQENPLPENEEHIDVIEIPPAPDDQTDVEDFDDDVIAREDLDPTFLPADVPGRVELHQYNYEEKLVSDAPPKKQKKMQEVSWKKKYPVHTKLPPGLDGADQRKQKIIDSLHDKNPVEIFELFFTDVFHPFHRS